MPTDAGHSFPYLRSSLARTLHAKVEQDSRDVKADHSPRYFVNTDELPDDIKLKFCQLNEDEETTAFLEKSRQKSDWIFTQLFHSVVKSVLSYFVTTTTINGLLGRGSMFVLSSAQFRHIMSLIDDEQLDTLIDLGAGDGKVTEKIATSFRNVYATEMSPSMRRNLASYRNFTVLDVNEWHQGRRYDVVSCLNLLDRCDEPMSLLRQIHNTLNENGKLLVAIVLPLNQYNEMGGKRTKPAEVMPVSCSCASVETQIADLVRKVFEPTGYELIRFSRVPYLCEGDLTTSYYLLSDYVFVLGKR